MDDYENRSVRRLRQGRVKPVQEPIEEWTNPDGTVAIRSGRYVMAGGIDPFTAEAEMRKTILFSKVLRSLG